MRGLTRPGPLVRVITPPVTWRLSSPMHAQGYLQPVCGGGQCSLLMSHVTHASSSRMCASSRSALRRASEYLGHSCLGGKLGSWTTDKVCYEVADSFVLLRKISLNSILGHKCMARLCLPPSFDTMLYEFRRPSPRHSPLSPYRVFMVMLSGQVVIVY